MRKFRGALAVGGVVAACYSCIGDNAGGVRGTIVDSDGRGFDSCVLRLYKPDNAIVDERKIPSEFVEIFSLPPKVSKYRVVVGCDGSSEQHAVDGIVLGTRESYLNPVDLGRIVLPRSD